MDCVHNPKGRNYEGGGAAAMREALEAVRTIIGAQGGYWADKALPIIVAALSAPPRNCDVYRTATSVLKAWDGGLCSASDIVRMLDWLFSPYEYRTPAPALDVVMANPEMKTGKED